MGFRKKGGFVGEHDREHAVRLQHPPTLREDAGHALLVIAGGKKLPELEALKMAADAIAQGASGVDMGRNIFQSDAPVAMLKAVRKVVHEAMNYKQAYEYFLELKNQKNG